jgi:hypothetical protein
MKKFLFVAIAAFAFTFAKAQTPGPEHNVIHTTLTLANVLELQLQVADDDRYEASMSASFANEEDLEDGKILTQADATPNMPFWIASNNDTKITIKGAAASFVRTGPATSEPAMPVGVLNWHLVSNNTGELGAAGPAPLTWTALTTSDVTMIAEAEEGSDATQAFVLELWANPGFQYPAGVYTMDVVVTATVL